MKGITTWTIIVAIKAVGVLNTPFDVLAPYGNNEVKAAIIPAFTKRPWDRKLKATAN